MDVMITAYEGYKFNLSNFGVGCVHKEGKRDGTNDMVSKWSKWVEEE
jgi:hypothetical protein